MATWCGDSVGVKWSGDKGVTWSAYRPVFGNSPDEGIIFPEITQSEDGTLWLVWHSNLAGSRDIWYANSTDYGITWSVVHFSSIQAEDSGPSVAQVGDHLWISWASDLGGDREIFYRYFPLPCPGNMDSDTDVDGKDLSIFARGLDTADPLMDLNSDEVLDGKDHALFSKCFGRTDCSL
jgi:hypothetical protein